MANFRLKFRETEIDLPPGELVIGRGVECFLRINDELVSRRHARLLVSPASVVFEDLASRNGSRVNGVAITGSMELRIGDNVEIGSQLFTLLEDVAAQRRAGQGVPSLRPCRTCRRLIEARLHTCPHCGARQTASDEIAEVPTRSMTSFALLLGLGDKMLALGRAEEAEKMIGPRLRELSARAGRGDLPSADEVAQALQRGVRLAGATRRSDWFVWAFDFARLAGHRMDEALLDELQAAMSTAKPTVGEALTGYVATLIGDDPATELPRRRLEAMARLAR